MVHKTFKPKDFKSKFITIILAKFCAILSKKYTDKIIYSSSVSRKYHEYIGYDSSKLKKYLMDMTQK